MHTMMRWDPKGRGQGIAPFYFFTLRYASFFGPARGVGKKNEPLLEKHSPDKGEEDMTQHINTLRGSRKY